MNDSYNKQLEFFNRYFSKSVDYPDPTFHNLLSDSDEVGGVMWEYISNVFLNGYINYLNIKCAFGIHRYTHPNEKDINKICESHHSNLDAYEDDILILAKSKQIDRYFYFHYDRDVSDCMIGSFITDDDYQTIRSNFIDHVYAKNKYLCCQYTGMSESSLEMDQRFHPIQIKISDLKGWIKG